MDQIRHFVLIFTINIDINFKLRVPSSRTTWLYMTNVDIKFLMNIKKYFIDWLWFWLSSDYEWCYTWNTLKALTRPPTWFFNENIIAFPQTPELSAEAFVVVLVVVVVVAAAAVVVVAAVVLICWSLLSPFKFSLLSSTSVILRIFFWFLNSNFE